MTDAHSARRLVLLSLILLATPAVAKARPRVPYSVPPQDGRWSQLPPLPAPVSNNAVASVQRGDGTTTLFSFMGIEVPTSPATITEDCYRLDWPAPIGQQATWVPIADAPKLNGRGKIAANAVTVNRKPYLIGGYTVQAPLEVTEKRLFRYEETTDSWTRLSDVPVEVDDTLALVHRNRWIYLVSGWHGPTQSNVPDVQVYDTRSDSWSQATPIPGPGVGLFGHAGSISDGTLLYTGGARSGFGFPISSRTFRGEIDPAGIGDPTTIQWTEISDFASPPTYRAAGSLGPTNQGFMLIAGGSDNTYNYNGTGYNGQPSNPLDQVTAFDPTSGKSRPLTLGGTHTPTMDHRGLVPLGRAGWATVGGMTAPGQTTDRVYRLRLRPTIQL